MIEVGSVVKSKFRVANHVARMGLVVKLLDRPEGKHMVQVFWPHSRSTGWVKCEDMEVINASR